MAKNDMKKCTEWLCEQKKAMEEEDMGRGDRVVKEKLTQQRERTKSIGDFRSSVDKALDSQKASDDARREMDLAYKTVLALSQKREGCLDTVSRVASVEGLIQGLSLEFDAKALHLVNRAENCREVVTTDQASPVLLSNETLAKASQNCIQAVRVNWRWLVQLWQCTQVHLRNAAAYHQFFHEAEEAEQWMNITLSRIHLTFDPTKLQGDRADALAIQSEIKDVLTAFLQWQTKTEYLFDKGKEIVPLPQRTSELKEERSVLALTDFSDDQITFIEGEVLFLVDNSDRKKWKVRNNAGQTGVVPAVLILIPAPYGPAIETALRLRRQLLALWTGSVKRLGYQLIAFMLLVLRDWNQEEVGLLQRLSPKDRDDLTRVLNYLETTLVNQHWQGYGDFEELQSRIHRLVMIIEEVYDDPHSDNEFLRTVVIQIKTLEDLLRKYQDFWTFWETFRTLVELVRHPELLLVCDKWDQLNYRATAHIVKFWDTNLDLAKGDLTKKEASLALHRSRELPQITDLVQEEVIQEEVIQENAVMVTHQTPTKLFSDVTIAEERQDMTTETVSTSVSEEQVTFLVKGVLDPRDGKTELDLQAAILLGIVDQAQGVYINTVTGESMKLQQAMLEGKLKVETLSMKKLSEEKKSYGLLTIKTTRETRPYTIKGVRDPSAPNKVLTVEEATQKGVLTQNATYRTAAGATISLSDAIEKGFLDVTYDEAHPPGKPEVVSKTYAVWGVVNQRLKEKVSFSDAVRLGLLNRETGEYLNNVTQERMPVQVAIMRGFVKARYLADPSKLNIDPRNTIVVQKLENARKKLMREIHTIQAFKAMAKQVRH